MRSQWHSVVLNFNRGSASMVFSATISKCHQWSQIVDDIVEHSCHACLRYYSQSMCANNPNTNFPTRPEIWTEVCASNHSTLSVNIATKTTKTGRQEGRMTCKNIQQSGTVSLFWKFYGEPSWLLVVLESGPVVVDLAAAYKCYQLSVYICMCSKWTWIADMLHNFNYSGLQQSLG